MSQSTRPVAIVNDGSFYVGPPLARAWPYLDLTLS
jgi:hypothetical protein